MVGVQPEVMTHQLNIDFSFLLVKQKKRRHAQDRQKAIETEIKKLLGLGHIRRVHYPEWLANVVLVKKPTGEYRMCVDFTDLNKACPKDNYPLPSIDQLVDAAAGYAVISLLDAKAGYHQIPMEPRDEQKTSFITHEGTYCYRVMPFGLKNAGATYQRLVNEMFKGMIGETVEVYVDDMIIKSKDEEAHAADVRKVFKVLQKYRLKLNSQKCTFEVRGGKFMGYMISEKGIKASPGKIQAIINMKPPQTLNEVQRLNGRINALGRFISFSAKRCLPFYKAIKQDKAFKWDECCQEAFENLKTFLASPPLLSRPQQGEPLVMYLASTDEAVGAVLVREQDNQQYPIYYTSKVSKDAELRYPKIENYSYYRLEA